MKRELIISAAVHLAVFLLFIISSSLRFPWNEPPLEITWVEIPKGASDEIGLAMKKAENLPKTTIEEQKGFPPQQQKPLSPLVRKTVEAKKEPKMAEPTKKPEKPKVSATDRKIKEALEKIDKKLKERTAEPEAAQVKEHAEGYRYGTGTDPLKVLPNDPEYLKYQALVRAKVIEEWIIPPRYAEDGEDIHFNARIVVMMSENGEITTTKWESHSGNLSFDASCLRAIQRASPLPKPPERLAGEVYNEGFLLEFDPKLKP